MHRARQHRQREADARRRPSRLHGRRHLRRGEVPPDRRAAGIGALPDWARGALPRWSLAHRSKISRSTSRRSKPSLRASACCQPGSRTNESSRHRLSRLQLRSRCESRAGEGDGRHGEHGLARRRGRACDRSDRAAGRFRLRRLSAHRRHGRPLAHHARRGGQGEGRHSGARHLQRLPGAVRGGPPAGRPDAQRVA